MNSIIAAISKLITDLFIKPRKQYRDDISTLLVNIIRDSALTHYDTFPSVYTNRETLKCYYQQLYNLIHHRNAKHLTSYEREQLEQLCTLLSNDLCYIKYHSQDSEFDIQMYGVNQYSKLLQYIQPLYKLYNNIRHEQNTITNCR